MESIYCCALLLVMRREFIKETVLDGQTPNTLPTSAVAAATYMSYPIQWHAQALRRLPFSCEPYGEATGTPHDLGLLRFWRGYERIWKES